MGIALQFVPVDVALIVGDVDAVYLIAVGEVDVAIKCSPSEASGTDEEIIEAPRVECQYA